MCADEDHMVYEDYMINFPIGCIGSAAHGLVQAWENFVNINPI